MQPSHFIPPGLGTRRRRFTAYSISVAECSHVPAHPTTIASLGRWLQDGYLKRTQKRRRIIVEKMGHLCQSTAVPRSSINRGRNLRLSWALVAGRASKLLVVGRKWRIRMNVQRTAGLQPSRFFPLGLGPGVGGLLQRMEEEKERGREEGKKAENNRRKKG